jgi:hypothetical protein
MLADSEADDKWFLGGMPAGNREKKRRSHFQSNVEKPGFTNDHRDRLRFDESTG